MSLLPIDGPYSYLIQLKFLIPHCLQWGFNILFTYYSHTIHFSRTRKAYLGSASQILGCPLDSASYPFKVTLLFEDCFGKYY